VGAFDKVWRSDPEVMNPVAKECSAAPFVDVFAQREAGHQADLHTVARGVMMKILAFVEECIISRYKGEASQWILRPGGAGGECSTATNVEQNIEVVRRYFGELGKPESDPGLVNELLAPDVVMHRPEIELSGIETIAMLVVASRDLGVGLRQVRLRLQKDLGDRAPIDGSGLQVFDVVDRGRENAFVERGKPAFHLRRVQAGKLPGDGDHRDIDIGKDVRRGPQNNERTEDENEESQDNKGIGTAERNFDDPHLAFSFASEQTCAGTAKTLVSQRTGLWLVLS
jgi:hypothetical protein